MEDGTHQGKNEYSFQAHYHTNLMQVFLKYYHVERLTQILNTYHKAARLIQNGKYTNIRYFYYVVMTYSHNLLGCSEKTDGKEKRGNDHQTSGLAKRMAC